MNNEAVELRTRAETFHSLAISYDLHCRQINSPVAQAAYEEVLAAVMEAEHALMATAEMLDPQLSLNLPRPLVLAVVDADETDPWGDADYGDSLGPMLGRELGDRS